MSLFLLLSFLGAAAGQENRPGVIAVNRTLPRVEPPPAGLTFSASPTPQDFFRTRVFDEPLVPIGGEPSRAENAALAAALLCYSQRAGPDDFSSLTSFLREHPGSAWSAALLTDLGIEYYNTAHYSLALDAWARAWALAKDATDSKGKAIADRAVGELACLYARLGRMTELEPLLKSVEGRGFIGAATELISGARGGLSEMKNRPEISFRCGPLALHRIMLSLDPQHAGTAIIFDSASTTNGLSLAQVAALSQKVDLNYQMAFRVPLTPSLSPSDGERVSEGRVRGDFVVPSVVHWKVGHYAALVRQEGDLYLLQDPTFRNDVWVTRAALEAESSGYFVIPPGRLAAGWRAVAAREGDAIWGKGFVAGPDPGGGGGSGGGPNDCPGDPGDRGGGGGDGDGDGGDLPKGMAISSVDLLFVSLSLTDQPVGYSPPVGPPVRCVVTYNQRDAFQPANFTYSNFGPKWTFDWLAYIKDDPTNTLADVQYYRRGGFARFFTGFNSATMTYAMQRLDRTRLTRTSPTSYEMLSPDGSRKIFSQSDGSLSTSRKIFLTQIIDPMGNAISLTYDANLRLVAITDAIGQVTTLTHGNPNDIYKITRVTDPFGRFATFDYDASSRLTNITDVIGLTSRFTYEGAGDFINSLITPYGTNIFTKGESGTTRSLETLFPDGNRERVEFNQNAGLGIVHSDPAATVPVGMLTGNYNLIYRNTYYWSKTACAGGHGDYTKAKIYHWLHTADGVSAARVLESEKEPLEGRVWYDYAGQSVTPYYVGTNNKPAHVGRVLDDGTTQLFTYEYNAFGKMTQQIDPIGRTTSYLYATNGIDLLETRQTRAGQNELLSQTTYNTQHLPLTQRDAAGQVTTFTYNPRGQVLTQSDPNGATTTHTYDSNGYRTSVDGPLPGPGDNNSWTYDSFGRVRTRSDESGYTLTFDYDALDRLTKITFPDATFQESTYTRLDLTQSRDRSGRVTSLEYNAVRQMAKRTDPLNRVTQFQWCKCGGIKSLTDPMGRTTDWRNDVQGRPTAKVYPDGSEVRYVYETTTSRLRQRIDEKLQVTQYDYNRDDTLSGITYPIAAIATPAVVFAYDPNHRRLASMTDGTGKTIYGYGPITGAPALGAGLLASVDGPSLNDTITFGYDELGRRVSTAIHGVADALAFDVAGRVTSVTNALGTFNYTYDGSSPRPTSQTYPNGQTARMSYAGNLQDQLLQGITNKFGNTAISAFIYGRDVAARRITSWSQQSGTQTPALYSFIYDEANQVVAASVSEAGVTNGTFGYSYDPAGNRLNERIDGTTNTAIYNALNQLTTTAGAGNAVTNEWDAEQRLVAVNAGGQRTEFSYDGWGRRVGIRQLASGSEVSHRRFVWCDDVICEERDTNGVVSKRFLAQGMKLETGAATGSYFYTRDHLGSIREMTDTSGNVRARYAYDPFGRRTRVTGDLEADFGFAGMFFSAETGLSLTRYRAYDPILGRWLSRDPLKDAEIEEGANLYAYVRNDAVNLIDPLGLCCEAEKKEVLRLKKAVKTGCKQIIGVGPAGLNQTSYGVFCAVVVIGYLDVLEDLEACEAKPCTPPAAKCEK